MFLSDHDYYSIDWYNPASTKQPTGDKPSDERIIEWLSSIFVMVQ
jgi:hypothetical protein